MEFDGSKKMISMGSGSRTMNLPSRKSSVGLGKMRLKKLLNPTLEGEVQKIQGLLPLTRGSKLRILAVNLQPIMAEGTQRLHFHQLGSHYPYQRVVTPCRTYGSSHEPLPMDEEPLPIV